MEFCCLILIDVLLQAWVYSLEDIADEHIAILHEHPISEFQDCRLDLLRYDLDLPVRWISDIEDIHQ